MVKEELSNEQLDQLRLLISILSTLSMILGSFVVVTFLTFNEKRKTSTSILILFQAMAGTLMNAVFMIPGYAGSQLAMEGPLCFFQAAGLLFLGNCTQMAWFFITLNLFIRVQLDRSEISSFYPIFGILVLSSLLTAVPLLTDSITFEGAWCFIDNEYVIVMYTCFYGIMIALSLIGTPLWVMIISKMAMAIANDPQIRSASHSEQRALLSVESSQFVGYRQKLLLLVRQACYVTGFLILFYIMLANRITLSVFGPSFPGWVIHATAIGVLGIYIFLIFGLTERNFQLWQNLFSSINRNYGIQQSL